MSLLPLHKDQLGNDKGDYEDEHHLRVHGLMAFVLGVHSCMLNPVKTTKYSNIYTILQLYIQETTLFLFPQNIKMGKELVAGNMLLIILTEL